jgi:hypothetical protein
MSVNRGDVILTYVPNIGSPGGKVRPALVVQSDHNNARLSETIIAAITSNTSLVRQAGTDNVVAVKNWLRSLLAKEFAVSETAMHCRLGKWPMKIYPRVEQSLHDG